MVLDSVGAGAMPDAAEWGDAGASTLGTLHRSGRLDIPNLRRLGIGNIDGLSFLGAAEKPLAATARMEELSKGKDTTIGHWEISGVLSPRPLPTYPDGFPLEVVERLDAYTHRGWLCNKPYSGTDVIRDYGREHEETGALIVYTSADSVFQIAAHESVVPVEKLYEYCEIARRMLVGRHGVGRVIARPFEGEWPYRRTSRRHDYSLVPPRETMLDRLKAAGLETISVGKIYDIFAGKSVSESNRTTCNADGIEKTLAVMDRDFEGLCFVNLVDFDMTYGHRNDVPGYAAAMTAFDRALPDIMGKMREDDLLIITADHGCDPATPSTDHSREYTPMLAYGSGIRHGVDLGTRKSFADISATVLEYLGVPAGDTAGESFLGEIAFPTPEKLMESAVRAREFAYVPYSGFRVGAALLTKNGKIYTGCNVESASYSPTNCAERTALFKAVSEGDTEFSAIAVVGGMGEKLSDSCPPCGVCRQMLAEFCSPDMPVYLGTPKSFTCHTLGELLPYSFTRNDLS